MRVLVVEDEWMIADDITVALTKAGYAAVAVASSVQQALKQLDEQGCDVAVLDVNLGGASADLVAQTLQLRSIPFLVVSGYASDTRSPTLAEAPFLAKPYIESELVAAIEALASPPNPR
jgi:DNA-binding response OmpR family regulator